MKRRLLVAIALAAVVAAGVAGWLFTGAEQEEAESPQPASEVVWCVETGSDGTAEPPIAGSFLVVPPPEYQSCDP